MLKRVLPFQSFTSVESGFTTETSYSRLCLFPSLSQNSLMHTPSLPTSILF